jgi:hypothetical protein
MLCRCWAAAGSTLPRSESVDEGEAVDVVEAEEADAEEVGK